MKALKIVLGIFVALILFILVLGIFAPSENHINRSVVIHAPMKAVQAQVMSFEAMLKWSPWADRDPNQKVTIENDGQVGALYTWSEEDSLVG